MSQDVLSVDQLVKIYLDKSGKVSAQFGRLIHQATPETQSAVLAKIVENGMKPYNIKPRKPKTTEARYSLKEACQTVLDRVRKEIAEAEEELRVLRIVQQYYTKKLAGTGMQVEISFVDSGSAGATHQQKAKSIGQAISTPAPCDTSSGDASGALIAP